MPGRRHLLQELGQALQAFFRRRFALLFVFLLASLLIYPYAETSTLGFYAFRTLSSAIILLTVYAVAVRRSIMIILLVLAVPSILHHLFSSPSAPDVFVLIDALLSLLFDLLVVTVLFRSVYSDMNPGSETIFGALCIYLLIGYAFAGVYSLVARFQPHAFFLDPLLNGHSTPDRFDLIFYSFGTMTELGTAGVTAISREVRSVSLLEAVIGILYLAVLISRLMSASRLSFAKEHRLPHPTSHPPEA